MKINIFIFTFFIISIFWGGSKNAIASNSKDSLKVKTISFVENKGQWNNPSKFRANLNNARIWIEPTAITFDLDHPSDIQTIIDYKSNAGKYAKEGKVFPTNIRKHSYQMLFTNSNSNAPFKGVGLQPSFENYILGNDPSRWVSEVKKYDAVLRENLYPNIDYKIYQTEENLKWDFIVHKGGNPENIQIQYIGLNNIRLSKGNLILETSVNELIELKPYVYQLNKDGIKEEIKCRFKLIGTMVSFELLEKYDENLDLIIDPTLKFASYTGSQADNWGYTATYDSKGFLYAGGISLYTGYPITLGAYDSSFNGGYCDISISKFDTSGTFLKYSTYIGGSGSDLPNSLFVNSNDELYILGVTGSSDFPMKTNSFDPSFNGGNSAVVTGAITFPNGSDIIISRLSNNGTSLISSTYFGGTLNDGLNLSLDLKKNYADEVRGEIIIDPNDNVYIVGSTYSINLPNTTGGFQVFPGGNQDGFVAKFDATLSSLVYASYLGGSNDDALYSVAMNNVEDIYVTGGTSSSNFPTKPGALFGSFQGGPADGFVTKINKLGNTLMKSTFFGTSVYDQSYFVDLDRDNQVFIFGQTNDATQALHINSLWYNPNGGQFITKLKPNLDSITWSTIWGNSVAGTDISPSAFMVDVCNRIYCAGWGGATNSFGSTAGLPISSNAFQSSTDGSDYYFLVINNTASAMVYGTFFGGAISHEHVDGGTSRFDNKGTIYQAVCAGCNGNSDFPTKPGCHSSINGSTNCNLGVIKFDFEGIVVIADFIKPQIGCTPYTVNFNNTTFATDSTQTTYYWNFGDGSFSTLKYPSHTYTQSGTYTVTLIASNPFSCNLTDTMRKQVTVISNTKYSIPVLQICPGEYVQIGLQPVYNPLITYNWTPSTNISNIHISNPIVHPATSTLYTLLVSNGTCTDTILQQVNVMNIVVNAGNDTTLCHSNISLTAHTKFTGLSYHWSSNPQFTDTLNSNFSDSVYTATMIGQKTFYVKASFGNCFDIDSINVTTRIVVQHSTYSPPKCKGDNLGIITAVGSGGKAPYSYHWNTGMNTPTISGLAGGIFTVTVTDADGCFTVRTDTLIEPDSLLSIKKARNIPCKNSCIGEAYADPLGGTAPYSWQWNDGSLQTTNPATNLCDGTYLVTITDANNCKTYDTINIIDSSMYINIITSVSDSLIYEGQTVQILTTNLGSGYTYTWTPATGLNSSLVYNPLATPLVNTWYHVLIQDLYGCTWRDSIYIEVIDVICEEPYIFVPNAFTPNNDGKNDILYVRANVSETVNFKIYNRWGEVVFETNDISNGWDGYFKGNKCEPAVYDFYLEIVCYNKEKFVKKGNITLIR